MGESWPVVLVLPVFERKLFLEKGEMFSENRYMVLPHERRAAPASSVLYLSYESGRSGQRHPPNGKDRGGAGRR